jgi:hypothetical protein
MAPRLIARSFAFPVRWNAPAPARATEIDLRPDETPKPVQSFVDGSLPLFQGQGAARVEGEPDHVSGSFHVREAQAPAGV